jgi:hypothetical protein
MVDNKIAPSYPPLSTSRLNVEEIIREVLRIERECMLALLEDDRKRKEENCA